MKSWQPLTSQPKEGYDQVSAGESGGGSPGGKFVPGNPSGEFRTNTSGEGHSNVKSSKFCGDTKGNKDLPPNRTAGAPASGGYKGS